MTDTEPWQIGGNPTAEEVAAVLALLGTQAQARAQAPQEVPGWAGYWRRSADTPPRSSSTRCSRR
ncbi:acyl-CoA carboxylase epsilon subunit [Naumannella halotolerans]|uniref:Acyl-CoA carboxylase epsilon subunit-like protein n=1 Tax=Naumannella halotolerans TaxID=993414 RepID=A0A4R7J9C6_9ACTN|nr:acyl-CoA carboxylase epsilon subunit [Naumannella halotolerans]TDT34122.1 acyl-CoA carboxylase epsilon subunit-like protein [Naumannella halotolerans]